MGTKLKIGTGLLGHDGKALLTNKATSVVNGGPLLVMNGQEDVTVKRDGMVHPNDGNSFYYGWVHSGTRGRSPVPTPRVKPCWSPPTDALPPLWA